LQPFLVGFLRIASLYFIFYFLFFILFFWEKNEFWGITQNWVMTNEVVRMIERTSGYYMIDDIFYKRSTSAPLLKCLSPQKSSYVLQEIYEGVCGLHTSSSSSGDISRILLANHTSGCHGPSE
jgi:hypothetical protein